MRKKLKCIGYIVIIILIITGIVLFLSKFSQEKKQDYFQGKIIEHTKDYIIVQPDMEYSDLMEIVGNEIKIDKNKIVKDCDFSLLNKGEKVRVLYGGVDTSKKKIEHFFAIYLSEHFG